MHVDFPQEKTPYDKLEKNVIVAGDTSNGLLGLKFLQKLQNKGFTVFAVDGNHEHYANANKGRTTVETIDRFRSEFPNTGIIDGVPVIGCNGWYNVRDDLVWARYQNDCRNIFWYDSEIAALKVQGHMEMDYLFLRDQLDMADEPVIVVTHTAPCLETLNPDYEGSFTNEWYYNPLMYRLLEAYTEKILVWCHGHTHAKNEAIVSGVRVVCNPRGYPGENPDWEPLTIEV